MAEKVTIDAEDLCVLVTCATRYAIGRRSYMPYLVQGIVRGNMRFLDDKTLHVLVRDIDEAWSLGDPDIDAPGWLQLKEDCLRERKGRIWEGHEN